MAVKYIFFTGGVVSSVGKGVTAAALGRLLKERGFQVAVQKLDPYINVDPGTMSPYQHGEVFVLDDGAETDLDLGHYERFIDIRLNRACNITTGQVYHEVIGKETPRRLPGRHHPGYSPHHQRNQTPHSAGRQIHRGRDRPGRSGRNGWRYRKPALPRSPAPDARRPGPRKYPVYPRHLAALHRRDGRVKDQTHPAFGARTALDRYLPGYDRGPFGLPDRRQPAR